MPHRESLPSLYQLKKVDIAPPGSYLERSRGQLQKLASTLGLGEHETKQLLHALETSTGSWGKTLVPSQIDSTGSLWLSGLSNDHSPFEWSITLQQKTGEAELRFTVEGQPTENTLSSARSAALEMNESIKKVYGKLVSFENFERIRDLFLPSHPNEAAIIVAWHSFVSDDSNPSWKIYLDPRVRGLDNVFAVTQEALRLLGIPSAWSLLRQILSPNDFIPFIALDLCADAASARIKVYVAHRDATAAEVAEKHAAICPDASPFEIERFYRAMAGSSGPYRGPPVISTFAFTSLEPNRPIGTVNFRADAYISHDAEVQARIERYFDEGRASSICKERYRNALAAVSTRPLELGTGIHSWIGLKTKRGGALQSTIYFSPELFGPVRFADGTKP